MSTFAVLVLSDLITGGLTFLIPKHTWRVTAFFAGVSLVMLLLAGLISAIRGI